MIKYQNFHTLGGGTSLLTALWNRQTDLHALNNLSSMIDKVSFKSNSMSLALVLLEEKLSKQMWMPNSDAISAD